MILLLHVASLLTQTNSASDGGVDPSYIAAATTVAVGLIAALSAIGVYVLGQRAASRDRKRELCGKAIAHALAWMELPYRIRRRVDNNPDTLRTLADRIHELQESLLFYSSWLRVELPQAHDEYQSLVNAVKQATRASVRDAWCTNPSAESADMNIEELKVDRAAVDERVSRFTAIVRRRFG
jgi:hypothetical protein